MQEFDDDLKRTFETVVGLALGQDQWGQAGLRVKQSGLGLSRAGDIADVAYLCSRDAAYDDCLTLDAGHVWDDGARRAHGGTEVIGEWLGGCITRVNAVLPVKAASFALARVRGLRSRVC